MYQYQTKVVTGLNANDKSGSFSSLMARNFSYELFQKTGLIHQVAEARLKIKAYAALCLLAVYSNNCLLSVSLCEI